LACSRHEVRDRFDFADSRKMRPTKTLRHPMEKRRNAETRVKVSTWCDKMAAPILYHTYVLVRWTAEGKRGDAYSISISPRAPRPKSLPRTGKNLVKKTEGQPNSDIRRTSVWKMMKSLLRTAQNAPAG